MKIHFHRRNVRCIKIKFVLVKFMISPIPTIMDFTFISFAVHHKMLFCKHAQTGSTNLLVGISKINSVPCEDPTEVNLHNNNVTYSIFTICELQLA